MRGWFLPSREMGTSFSPVIESLPKGEYASRWSKALCPSSVCWIANLLSYGLMKGWILQNREDCLTHVTGISPQSTTLRPVSKGLTSRGTLYPPQSLKRREPARIPARFLMSWLFGLVEMLKPYLGRNVLLVCSWSQCPAKGWERMTPSTRFEKELTNGAPMKAMSKGDSLSLVRHWTQGSFANVVMPEKIASPVTDERWGRYFHEKGGSLPSPFLPRYMGWKGNLT